MLDSRPTCVYNKVMAIPHIKEEEFEEIN